MDETSDDRIVDEVVGRLEATFPSVSREAIASQVTDCLRAFARAPIRDFLPVLVERRVSRALRPVALAG